ncbi:hypothetical protein O181_005057 [Austropuccinia psidii MF-1]|uniref:Copia protein n=1 Tax=Austropuccinia psidii MF-1 TaxID=1389203 RepID=A0A9Q3GGC9_9BASI|nr:hypothetical protein [Austropuccinia psidii MF-1]
MTRRSITGDLVTLESGLIIWKTCKKPNISVSSAEAEYRALTDLAKESLWIRQFGKEIKIFKNLGTATIHKDNEGFIYPSNSDCNSHGRIMKHVEIQLNFIQEVIKRMEIQLQYTTSADLLEDFLTKSVCQTVIQRGLRKLILLRLEDRKGDKQESIHKSEKACELKTSSSENMSLKKE